MTNFDEHLEGKLKDPEFRRKYEEWVLDPEILELGEWDEC